MRDHWGPDHRVLRRRALGVLVLAAMLAGAASAPAATYHAYLCKVPVGPNAGRPAPTDGTDYTSNTGTGSAAETCASGGAMTAALDGGVTHQAGEGAAVIYAAPGGTTIAGFRVWRHEAVGPTSASNTNAPFTKLEYGSALLEPDCSRPVGCVERGNASSPLAAANEVAVANLGGISQFRWNAFCGGVGGGTCPVSDTGARSAVYDVFAADVLLDDPAGPAVSGASGALLAGGSLTGAQSASFKATDAGSGVHEGALLVDGTVVTETVLDDAGGACADLGVAADGRPSFLHSQPCPAVVNGVLTLNTDLLAPGSHDLAIRVADAAGNQATASTVKITTTGPRPQGPNGTGASHFAKLTARHARTRRRARRLGFGARPTITGRLVDEHRQPIVGAAVDVLVRERRTGARSTPIATATTGADGSFRVTLPSGPSRTITVRYTAFSGDPKPAATVTLTALVRARLSAAISPRAPRVGRPVRITGRLRYLRRPGVVVSIQARQDGVWRTVDSVETRRDGRFSWPYRFRPGQAGRTFFFRARVKSPNYPFDPGATKPIRVRVRR
ncbi:MAG: hypothetical protein QOD69_2992 [Solirubrobacteraceae bacterium]|nr:hypothetical protein [Solirubrobacteraceae bacterium]